MNDPAILVGRSALLLDLDGTLYPAAHHGAYLDAVRRITGTRVQELYGASDPESAYVCLQADRASHGFRSDTETLERRWGIGIAEMNRFRERWTRPSDFLAPEPQVATAVERMLASRTLILGTNNTPALARRILEVLEIPVGWFAAILSSEDLATAKPDEGFFRQVCQRAGLPASAFVSVGDRAASDLTPAAQMGMGTWLVGRTEDLEALADACEAT